MSLIVGRKKTGLRARLEAIYPPAQFEMEFVFNKLQFVFSVTEKATGKTLVNERSNSWLLFQRLWVMFLLPPAALYGAVWAEYVGRTLGAPPLCVFFATIAGLCWHGWREVHWLAAFGKYKDAAEGAGGAPEEFLITPFSRAKSSTKKAEMIARALLGYWGAAKQSPFLGRSTAWPLMFWRKTRGAFPIKIIKESVHDGLTALEGVSGEDARNINPQGNWDDAMKTSVQYSKVLVVLWGRPLTPYSYGYYALSIIAAIASALSVLETIR